MFLPCLEQSSLLHSRPKSAVGTPAYIAPEVLSRREYDGKVRLSPYFLSYKLHVFIVPIAALLDFLLGYLQSLSWRCLLVQVSLSLLFICEILICKSNTKNLLKICSVLA